MPNDIPLTISTESPKESGIKDTLPSEIYVKPASKPNYDGWFLSNAIFNTSTSTIEQFIPLYAETIVGASLSQIGIITGIYAILNVTQLFWARISLYIGKQRIFVVLGWFFTALLYLPLALLKLGQIVLLTIIRMFQSFFLSATLSTQASLQADLISQKQRAEKISLFTRLSLIGSLLGTLLGGFLFTYFADTLNFSPILSYTILFLWTAILGVLASLLFVVSVPDYQRIDKDDLNEDILSTITVNSRTSKLSLVQKTQNYLIKFHNFWLFTVFACIFYFGVYLASPYYILLEINYYHFSYFQASILTGINTSVQILIAFIFHKSKILDIIGRKNPLFPAIIFIIIAGISAIVPYYITGLPAYLWCLGVWTLLGVGWGIFNLTLRVFLLDIAHPKYRVSLIAIFNTSMALANFAGPVIGGFISEFFNNLTYIFVLRAVIIFVAFFMLIKVPEPEIPGTLLKPVRNIFFNVIRNNAGRGPVMVISSAESSKTKIPHWFPTRRRLKPLK